VQRGSSVFFSQAPHCGNSGYPPLTVLQSAHCDYDPRDFGSIFLKRSAVPHIVDLADTAIPKVKLLYPLKADFKASPPMALSYTNQMICSRMHNVYLLVLLAFAGFLGFEAFWLYQHF